LGGQGEGCEETATNGGKIRWLGGWEGDLVAQLRDYCVSALVEVQLRTANGPPNGPGSTRLRFPPTRGASSPIEPVPRLPRISGGSGPPYCESHPIACAIRPAGRMWAESHVMSGRAAWCEEPSATPSRSRLLIHCKFTGYGAWSTTQYNILACREPSSPPPSAPSPSQTLAVRSIYHSE